MFNQKPKPAKDPNALRIVTQYRDKASMIYELRCGEVEIAVRMTPRQNSDDNGEWRIEVRHGRADDAAGISEWADTRRQALLEVSRNWVRTEATNGLPTFDWEEVARVLSDVRAL